MRKLLRALAGVALAVLCAASAPALAKSDCRKAAVAQLRAGAPDGFAVYRAVGDKSFFLNWLDCQDGQFGLPTAVHESVHYITGDIDGFPLVGGGQIARPHEVSRFYPPSRIAASFKSDDFVATYLRPGRATSASDFLYLLDELNAYSHDLNAAIDLKDARRSDVYSDNRDGLAAAMAFVAIYVERARAKEPATWSGLQTPEVAKTVATLWTQAEKVMQASCGLPHFGRQDKMYIGRYCTPEARAALQSVIGAPSLCPTDCLKAADDDDTVDAGVSETDYSPPALTRRTLWSRRGSGKIVAAPAAGSDDDAAASPDGDR